VFVNQAIKLGNSDDHKQRLAADQLGLYAFIRDALQNYDYERSSVTEAETSSNADDVNHSSNVEISTSVHSFGQISLCIL
jgi:hypothetical protein